MDPAKLEFARQFRARYPEDPETGAVAAAIRTGESQVYPEIPPVPLRVLLPAR